VFYLVAVILRPLFTVLHNETAKIIFENKAGFGLLSVVKATASNSKYQNFIHEL